MKKLFLGRILPIVGAGALLTSSISPLRPALNVFAAGASALAGEPAPNVEADYQQLESFFDLFGLGNKQSAAEQLQQIQERVKTRSGAPAAPAQPLPTFKEPPGAITPDNPTGAPQAPEAGAKQGGKGTGKAGGAAGKSGGGGGKGSKAGAKHRATGGPTGSAAGSTGKSTQRVGTGTPDVPAAP